MSRSRKSSLHLAHHRRAPRPVRRGLTLIELIVATVIAGILAGVATMSMASLIRGRDRSQERQAIVEAAYAATQTIARDMASLIRTTDLNQVVIRIESKTLDQSNPRDELIIFARDSRPVRPIFESDDDYRESDEYEIQYRLTPDQSLTGVLWRRRDPVVDERFDGGGLVVPLATNIRSVEFQAFDGEDWIDEWDSDLEGYPYALRAICTAVIPSSGALVRCVAAVPLDRIPPPFDPETGETYDPSADIRFLDFGNLGDQGGGGGSGLEFTAPPNSGGTGGGGGRRDRRDRRRGDDGGGQRGGGGGRDGGGGGGNFEFGSPRGGGG